MSKVYDPILCMLVEKPTTDSKVRYGEIISDIKLIRTNRDWEKVAEKIKTYERGGFITAEERRTLVEKLNDKRIKGVNDSSTFDRAIRAIDSEKGYDFDGYWIKPLGHSWEVTKNGKKIGEFATSSEAEKWIRGQYGD